MPTLEEMTLTPKKLSLNDMATTPKVSEQFTPDFDEETKNKIDNSLYYSRQFGIPVDEAYDIEPQLNQNVFGSERVMNPAKVFVETFKKSLAEKPAMMLRGIQVYTPGNGQVDKYLDNASTYLESLKDPVLVEKLNKVATGKLWPIGEDKHWWQVESKYLPEVINSWSASVADQIPIMLITQAGRMAGDVIGKPISAATGAVWALATGGPDPSDVVTAPAIVAITREVSKHLGGAAPMVAMEAGGFMDEALDNYNIDPDIAEKYARMYGLGSGTIEYAENLWLLGRYSKILKPQKVKIMKEVLNHIGGSALGGAEEYSQQMLQNHLIGKAIDEMKERHPEYDKEKPALTKDAMRSGFVGAGVQFLTGLPGTGMTITKGALARQTEIKPETKKFLGEPSVKEIQQSETQAAVEPTVSPFPPSTAEAAAVIETIGITKPEEIVLPQPEKGMMYIYHSTTKNPVDIQTEGLKRADNALMGGDFIFASDKPEFRYGNNIIVAKVPISDVIESTGALTKKPELRLNRDIRPDEIVQTYTDISEKPRKVRTAEGAGKETAGAEITQPAKVQPAEQVSEQFIEEKVEPLTPEEKAITQPKIEKESPARDILGGEEPITKIRQALESAQAVRPRTEAEQTAERKRRFAKAEEKTAQYMKEGISPEEAVFRGTHELKGELTNYDNLWEPIRDKIEQSSPGAVNEAFRSIWNSKTLKYGERLSLVDAFRKLIDGHSVTNREMEMIRDHFGIEMGKIAETRIQESSFYDKIVAVWKAGLLTGLKTSGLNVWSNLSHFISETVKDLPAAGVDILSSLMTGERSMVFTLKGIKSGGIEGAKQAKKYLLTGIDDRYPLQKYDYKRVNFGKGKIAEAIQFYVNGIFHLLGAEDQPFYYMSYAHDMWNQAYTQGLNKGLKGKILDDFAGKLVDNPTEAMVESAMETAQVAVFQNKTALGDIGAALQKLPGGQIVVPFSRTPAAIAMQIVNYTPVGVTKEIITQIKKGTFNQKKFSESAGRSIVGTGILVIGAELLKAGLMSLGYPKPEKERKQWEIEGRKENSIKIGNKWRSVYVLGPLGNVLLIGGYFQQSYQDTGSPSAAMATALTGGAKSIVDQTFMRGLSQAAEAINDPERSFGKYFTSMAGSVVPTIVADFARAMDSIERRTDNPLERIISRVPLARLTLEPKVDIFGQDLPRYGGNPLEVMIDPTRPSKIQNDLIVDELRRLWDKDIKVTPTLLGDRAGYEILTEEENTELWHRAGNLTYRALFSLIKNPAYQRKTNELKGKAIDEETKKMKDFARAEMAITKLSTGTTLIELRKGGLVTSDVEKYIKTLRMHQTRQENN